MKLVIVESPTKQRTIMRYLGKGYITASSLGHIRDLSKKGEHNLGIDVRHDFKPEYMVLPGKVKVVAHLKKQVDSAEEIFLATDPDREGEAISWHLAQELQLDLTKVKRLEFHEITPYGIQNAINNPRLINLDLVESQETRRMLDRMIGFRLSTLLRDKIQSQSAGRVQSAVLKLIVDRELEITNFVAQEYFLIDAHFTQDKQKYRVRLTKIDGKEKTILSQNEAESIQALINSELKIIHVQQEEKEYYPRPPFTTSTLQQEAFFKLKFSTSKTMKIAQELFEGVDLKECQQGIITYTRTDSVRINPAFINLAKKEIANRYGDDYIGKAYVQKAKENLQDAHEAIRPTNIELTPENVKTCLNKDQLRLYELIYYRTLASMMKPRQEKITTIHLQSQQFEFEFIGNEVQFLGYSSAYGEYEKLTEKKPFNAQVGQLIPVEKTTIEAKQTQPPYRYNEGSIVRTMEELGIGRPSTYVATIETLRKRQYVRTEKGYLFPSDQGKLTVAALEQYFETLVDAKYTAQMEEKLDKIEEGNLNKIDVLSHFYHDFDAKMNHASLHMSKVQPEEINEPCPVCGKPLVKRKGKFGYFIGCSGFPDCNYIRQEAKEIPANAKECPKCKQGKLVMRKGKYGNFLACNRYPDCDYLEKFKSFKKR